MSTTQMKNEMMSVIRREQCRFVMKIETAFEVKGRGTVLSGWFMGSIRVGSSVGCLMDARTCRALTDDMEVMGLERWQKLEDKLDAWEEPIGCGILVPTIANPASLAGMLFTGAYRVPQDQELTSLAQRLEDVRLRESDAEFAFYIKDVHDLGEKGTGLVGYMKGWAIAGHAMGCFYDADRAQALTGPVQVNMMLYRRKEETMLVSENAALPCGFVVSGHYSADMLRGMLLVEWRKQV